MFFPPIHQPTNPPTPHCGKLPNQQWLSSRRSTFQASQGRMPCERGIHPPTPPGIMASRWMGSRRHGRFDGLMGFFVFGHPKWRGFLMGKKLNEWWLHYKQCKGLVECWNPRMRGFLVGNRSWNSNSPGHKLLSQNQNPLAKTIRWWCWCWWYLDFCGCLSHKVLFIYRKKVFMADSFGVFSMMITSLHIHRVIGLQPFIWELVG